jgi:two-component system sensor histidine kinase/response regulator
MVFVYEKSGNGSTAADERRILVVDDSVMNQKLTVVQLQRLGLAADAVGNGLEAIAAYAQRPYDVVLMDCEMPQMDGYEATAEIRKQEAGTLRHIPIVAMTAHVAAKDRERCFTAGMDHYLAKPIRVDDLRKLLDKILSVVS